MGWSNFVDDKLTVSQDPIMGAELGETGLLRAVKSKLDLDTESDQPTTILLLTKHFLQELKSKGLRALLILDETETLSTEALKELCSLIDLHDGDKSLIQTLLVGQEHTWNLFRKPGMKDLHQRTIASCYLDPLTVEETKDYIKYRLKKVGWDQYPRIDSDCFPVVPEYSQGVPRRIIFMCSQLFLYGYNNKKYELGGRDAQLVMRELEGIILQENYAGDTLAPPTFSGIQ